MSNITFYYTISPSVIDEENNKFCIEKLSLYELEDIFRGFIFVFIENPRNYIKIETPILHYLFQFQMVINEIEKGNERCFSVSGDYYSNSFNYIYSKITDNLFIKEVNGGDFDISVNYSEFKKIFATFLQETLSELAISYPKLKDNQDFVTIDLSSLKTVIKTKNE